MKLILASSSPRRRDLMRGEGYDIEIVDPTADEVHDGDPYGLVVENARSKARSIRRGGIIVGADTIVLCNGEILGKPADRSDAGRMLKLQMRCDQEVITGICVLEGEREFVGYEVSGVVMDPCDDLEAYLESGLWGGKAGAYGIQDKGPIRARITHGDEDNVIGLPVSLLRRLLALTTFSYPEGTPG
ncbi:MAG: Maf family protein [Thermoplasmata archaeon]|nr:Maf family protein [Thermoplasmata archaeon]